MSSAQISGPQKGFRLSQQQTAIWLAQQRYESQLTCHCAFTLQGNWESERVKASLERIIERHEILRTTFHARRGVKIPLQVVAEVGSIDFRAVDLSATSGERQRREREQIVQENLSRPFNLADGPVFRAVLVCLSTGSHELLLSAPSLCADVGSLRNIAAELFQTVTLDTPASQEDVLQYADFAEWQNTLLEAEDTDTKTAKAFWEKNAQRQVDIALPLELTDSKSFAPAQIEFLIPAELATALDAAAREHSVKVASVFRAAWQALLWRLSLQPSFVTYEVVDGRHLEDVATAIGPYSKWLPMRWEFDITSLRFDEFLRDSGRKVQQALEWQDYASLTPQASGAEGEAPRIAFEYREGPQKHSAGQAAIDISDETAWLQPWKAKLTVTRSGGSWNSALQYNAAVLDETSAARLPGYFICLLCSAVTNPTKPIAQLDILDDAERRHLLVDFNATATPFPAGCIHQLFEQQAERTPEAPAVKSGAQVLSYRQLDERANALAHVLREAGVAADVEVGLLLPRSADTVVTLLATLKAGGAYVPLNPADPPERLRHQLAAAKVVITNKEFSKRIDGKFAGTVIRLDQQQGSPRPQKLVSGSSPDDLAYVIYTSGSTGIPKGVGISHRSLVNYAAFIQRKLSSAKPMRFATVSTFSTDLGNTCVFPALISGGCLDVVAIELAKDADALARYFAENPADVLKIVPSHLSAMLEARNCEHILPKKYLILGGETFSWELLRRIDDIPHGCKIINHYGPTETTVGALTFDVAAINSARAVPIGRPIANAEAYVLGANMQPVPTGVTGELYLGGVGLARGYIGQPEQTAERFVRHPFSDDPNARLYRTGDLARHLGQGYIEFLGRADYQVKVRGFRIELAEIESVLLTSPMVRDCVVVVREQDSDKRLLAYFTSPPGRPADVTQLRAWLEERLPEHMMPSAFLPLPKLPLTHSGKVDRAALPDPELASQAAVYVPPRNDMERAVAQIWATLLKLEQISMDANFFDVGGHSLLATQLVSRLRKQFEVDLPLRAVFEYPTVAGVSEAIQALQAEKINKAFSEVESLSEEEAERMLAEAAREASDKKA